MIKIILFFIICLIFYFIFNKRNIYNIEIDKIIYINLDNRPDRKLKIDKVIEQSKFKNYSIHRIQGTLNNNCGHIGCAYSHVNALKYAKENNFNSVMILEDDFEFINENILFEIPKHFDVFMLASVYYETIPLNSDSLFHKVKYATTTSGYIVKKHYYNTLIKCFEEAIENMEKQLQEFQKIYPLKKMYETNFAIDQHWFSLQRKDIFLISIPNIGTQRNSISSIMS